MSIIRKASLAFSAYNRGKKSKFIANYVAANEISTCLVVGAMPRGKNGSWNNIMEESLLEMLGEKVVFSGLESSGEGWPNWAQLDGRKLPFAQNSFDLVISNAVIEHVGFENDQSRFVGEHIRVGKHWIITTPNRLFPVESHTHKLFAHMVRGWSHEGVTRLLSKEDFRSLLPIGSKIDGFKFGPTFLAHK